MAIVDVRAAQVHLSSLMDRAAAGEEIVISRAGMPVARLVPLATPPRRFGVLRGQVWMADEFDDSTEVLEHFECGE